ncbi:glycosyl transferase family 2 [Methyloprofundus sedimenti]|uniref:Glycosyl transferase family 2 n=1 Tax=Methyloprofundus sedimenti TaxID=1420851 RepID=A0A1V8M5N9_9GAMM|nr:glycosyltransferase family 2 protein [Methyloprofundus sedimenti]OQK16723.1 glycosyl transferase family 2 [Methyloprofundus sedimenti]
MKSSNSSALFLSFVIPVKDEVQTLAGLYQGISDALKQRDKDLRFEVIFIDDGSTDGSWAEMTRLTEQYPDAIKAIKLRRNFGKAFALSTGFSESKGDIIFTMDADLQDDPAEIPKFLDKIAEGYDVVSGWKSNRQDPLSKTLPSKFFNKITAKLTGVSLHDFNCGFKAYKKEVLEGIKIYGELHRYIPVLAHELGFISAEVSIKHNKREFGVSKYGWERYARGLLDLLTVLATTRYLKKPGHLFGGLGVLSGIVGTIILSYLGILWLIDDSPIGTRPLFAVGILMVILSIQMISIGVLAELITRHSDSGPSDSAIADKRGCS